MCLECIHGSIVGGFEHCRLTDKYPHNCCEHFEPDPNYSYPEYGLMFNVDAYPSWNKALKQE